MCYIKIYQTLLKLFSVSEILAPRKVTTLPSRAKSFALIITEEIDKMLSVKSLGIKLPCLS